MLAICMCVYVCVCVCAQKNRCIFSSGSNILYRKCVGVVVCLYVNLPNWEGAMEFK